MNIKAFIVLCCKSIIFFSTSQHKVFILVTTVKNLFRHIGSKDFFTYLKPTFRYWIVFDIFIWKN